MSTSPEAVIPPPFVSPFNFVRLHEVTEVSVVVIEIDTHHEPALSDGGFAPVEYR